LYVATPPRLGEIFRSIGSERLTSILDQSEAAASAEYLHWDKLRHLEPPADLTHEEWWALIKISRQVGLRPLPLTDPDGYAFSFGIPDQLYELLHFVDQRCSGEIAMPEVVTADDQARRHYLVNSVMEEAIRSSQLEGATTSRRVAKELLQTGRPPRDRSEQMIVNNYRGLQFIRESLGEELTPSGVLELQRILTEGTLDNPDAAGRLQTSDEERVAIYDRQDGELVHKPPPADQLPERMESMCAFGNGTDSERWVHPVVRSTLLHFWLAYDHPFEDGNGRTARALFYWSMRKHGYWLTEYLSISRILRQAPAQHTRAFLLTETDERDTTYFTIYQLQVMRRAVDELHKYLQRKVNEVREVEKLIRGDSFNHRQLAVLSDAVRNPGRTYSFRTHASTHNVTHETARTDLTELWTRDLLTRHKMGARYIFRPADDLAEKLKKRRGSSNRVNTATAS
jgi:Fic family protein